MAKHILVTALVSNV